MFIGKQPLQRTSCIRRYVLNAIVVSKVINTVWFTLFRKVSWRPEYSQQRVLELERDKT